MPERKSGEEILAQDLWSPEQPHHGHPRSNGANVYHARFCSLRRGSIGSAVLMVAKIHVSPVNDIIEHDLGSDECVCGPTSKPVKRDDGSMGWVIVHHALDGRE